MKPKPASEPQRRQHEWSSRKSEDLSGVREPKESIQATPSPVTLKHHNHMKDDFKNSNGKRTYNVGPLEPERAVKKPAKASFNEFTKKPIDLVSEDEDDLQDASIPANLPLKKFIKMATKCVESSLNAEKAITNIKTPSPPSMSLSPKASVPKKTTASIHSNYGDVSPNDEDILGFVDGSGDDKNDQYQFYYTPNEAERTAMLQVAIDSTSDIPERKRFARDIRKEITEVRDNRHPGNPGQDFVPFKETFTNGEEKPLYDMEMDSDGNGKAPHIWVPKEILPPSIMLAKEMAGMDLGGLLVTYVMIDKHGYYLEMRQVGGVASQAEKTAHAFKHIKKKTFHGYPLTHSILHLGWKKKPKHRKSQPGPPRNQQQHIANSMLSDRKDGKDRVIKELRAIDHRHAEYSSEEKNRPEPNAKIQRRTPSSLLADQQTAISTTRSSATSNSFSTTAVVTSLSQNGPARLAVAPAWVGELRKGKFSIKELEDYVVDEQVKIKKFPQLKATLPNDFDYYDFRKDGKEYKGLSKGVSHIFLSSKILPVGKTWAKEMVGCNLNGVIIAKAAIDQSGYYLEMDTSVGRAGKTTIAIHTAALTKHAYEAIVKKNFHGFSLERAILRLGFQK